MKVNIFALYDIKEEGKAIGGIRKSRTEVEYPLNLYNHIFMENDMCTTDCTYLEEIEDRLSLLSPQELEVVELHWKDLKKLVDISESTGIPYRKIETILTASYKKLRCI